METGTVETVLSVVKSRRDFLDVMVDSSRTQAELADELDVSRSTVTRAIRTLEEHRLIERTGSEYAITTRGKAILHSFERHRDTVDSLIGDCEYLNYVPPTSPFHPDLVHKGTCHLIEQGQSFRIRERVNDVFRDAIRILGLARTRSAKQSLPIFRRKILEEERPVELVLDEDIFAYLKDELAGTGLFAADNFSASVVESAPYGLFVLDRGTTETVVLVVYDEADSMKGVIMNDTTWAVQWAKDVIRSFEETAVSRDVGESELLHND